MKTRILGKSGLPVSEVGLGCWQLGGDFGPVDDGTATAILEEAMQQGITFWDTADVYGAGQSERRIGEFLANKRHETIVATKVGRDAALFPDGYSRNKVRVNLQGSLQRLGTECLDLVQLHCVPPEVLENGELLEWMEDFKSEGLIRHWGASVETLHEALSVVTHPGLASLQIIFNVFRQDAIGQLFPQAAANNVGIIVRLPLASGVLAGKMKSGQAFDASDHRHYNRQGEAFSQGETFSGIPFTTALALVEEIRPQVPNGISMAAFAMRWLLDQPEVSTVIAGASRVQQVRENAACSALPPLSDESHRWLADFYKRRVRSNIVVPV